MSSPGSPTPMPPRRRAPSFTPRFTISLAYLVGFFALYSVMLVLPALLQVLGTMEPGPAQEHAAMEAARQAARPQIAAALSVLTTIAGAWLEVLPGLRVR